jgi:preprotein translocase subunit SecA
MAPKKVPIQKKSTAAGKKGPKAAKPATRVERVTPAPPARQAEAPRPQAAPAATSARATGTPAGALPPFRRPMQTLNFAGLGRNDICPCGSGKRFKNCHG